MAILLNTSLHCQNITLQSFPQLGVITLLNIFVLIHKKEFFDFIGQNQLLGTPLHFLNYNFLPLGEN